MEFDQRDPLASLLKSQTTSLGVSQILHNYEDDVDPRTKRIEREKNSLAKKFLGHSFEETQQASMSGDSEDNPR